MLRTFTLLGLVGLTVGGGRVGTAPVASMPKPNGDNICACDEIQCHG